MRQFGTQHFLLVFTGVLLGAVLFADDRRDRTPQRAGPDWWSLQPVRRPVPPTVQDAAWCRNPIDHFILAKLESKGLTPSPKADRRTLIRRLYFDLLGLPPSPEEVAAFMRDSTPDAHEKVVDRLLASPHYGERWARHWLDVVRFGESDGFERNTTRPHAWHYRDWVIRALNAEMPYYEFVRLQLAGDVLRPDDLEAKKATGFLVAGVHNTVLGNGMMKVIARQDELEEMVGSVGQTFLGLTINCARCHEHKFDPIAQADFYRLASALSGAHHGERDIPISGAQEQIERLTREIEQHEGTIREIEEPVQRKMLAEKLRQPVEVLPPRPFAAWDFANGLNDRIGSVHLQEVGNPALSPSGVTFDGKTAFLRSPPLPRELREKTLEAWVRLDNVTQRGGGVIGVQTPDGAVFDAIVFGEQEPRRWMAGSDGFRRYQSFSGPEETEANQKTVHFAITYQADGTITGYRNGKVYGKPYKSSGLATFAAKNAVVLLGGRHEPAGGNKMLAGTVFKARLHDFALSAEEIAVSAKVGGEVVTREELTARLPVDKKLLRGVHESILGKLYQSRTTLERRAVVRLYAAVSQRPDVTRLLHRGQVAEPREVITPGGPKAVTVPDVTFELPADAPEEDRRRKLAEWITHPDNPLFARVMVNRLWHYHFGAGIVETPNDFGFNGGRPSHPELLDWLAAEFSTRKFSLKSMHRLIVTSSTYRQAGKARSEAVAVDADNRLLWHKKPLRLEAESLRDAMLAVSGLLNRDIGGKGFSDYQETFLNGTTYFEPIDPVGPQFHRRSLYRFTPRGGNAGLLDAFDCPDPATAAPRRSVTTTPVQALSLLNNAFSLRMADAWANRLVLEAPKSVDDQIARAWQLAFLRETRPEELELARQLVGKHGLKALCRALFNANEFITVD